MDVWAVAYASLFDNELTIEIVKAKTMKEALLKHSKIKGAGDAHKETQFWLGELPNDLEKIKQEFFDADLLIDVRKIGYGEL